MRKFSEVLEEYLEQREFLKSDDYYDNRAICDRHLEYLKCLQDLANELDEIVAKVQNAGA